MLAKLRNIFGKSPQTNPYEAVAGETAGSLRFTRPFGLINGHTDGGAANILILATSWVKTLGSGTVTMTDGHPASLVIVTTNVVDAVTHLQLSKDGGTTAWKPLQLSTTDALIWRARVKISDATNSAFLVGLANTATSNIFGTSGTSGAIGSGITDFVGFHKPNGAATLNGVVRKSSTSTSQTLTGITLSDDTYVTLAVISRNGTAIEFWVNGALIYTQTVTTNMPLAATTLAPTISVQTPAAAAKTLSVTRPVWMQEAA